MATTVQSKRTTVSGRIPTTTDIAAGQLAVNLPDRRLFTSNGTATFDAVQNVTNFSVTSTLTINTLSANSSTGTSGQLLTSNGTSTYWSSSTITAAALAAASFGPFTAITCTATTDLSTVATVGVSITGTGTITSFGTGAKLLRIGTFAGSLILTHNATSLILPSNANITTAAGDRFVALSDATGNWTVVSYDKADGTALVTNYANSIQMWTGTSTNTIVNPLDGSRLLFGPRTSLALMGGGTHSYVSSCVSWSSAFASFNGYTGTENPAGSGYTYVSMPALNASIPVISGTAVTVTANGIPLAANQSLFFNAYTGGYFIVDITSTNYEPPPSAIWLCGQYFQNPVAHVKFATGVVLQAGQTSTIVDLTIKSTTTQAQAGTDDTTVMTPLKVNQAVAVGVFVGNTTANSVINSTYILVSNSTSSANVTPAGFAVGTTVINNNVYFSGNSTANTSANLTVDSYANSTITSTYGLAGLSIGVNVSANSSTISTNNLIISGVLTANSTNGTSGQLLASNGTGTYWLTSTASGVTTASNIRNIVNNSVNTTSTVVDTYTTTGYTAFDYLVFAYDNINLNYKSSRLAVVANSTVSTYSEYAVVLSNNSVNVCTFDASVLSGNVTISAVGDSNNVAVTLHRTTLGSATVAGDIAATSGVSQSGSNTWVNFNDSGLLGSSANLTFNKSTSLLSVGNTTVNTSINSVGFFVGSTVINNNVYFSGNSTANTSANLTSDSYSNTTITSSYGLAGLNVGANVTANAISFAVGNVVHSNTGITFSDTTILKTAAPGVDVASYLGFVVNPFMEISQENGSASISVLQTVYLADQFLTYLSTASTGTATAQQIADPFSATTGYKRFRNAVKCTIGTAQATLSANEYVLPALQRIEGNFSKGLGWGTTDAASVDVVAVVSASVTGTYSLAIRNAVNTRSYVVPISLIANTPTTIFVTIPGETTGVWATDNTIGLQITITAGCGSTYVTPSNNSWQTGYYFGVVGGGTNLAATASATFTIAYMNVFPTGVLPYTSAAQVDLAHLANMRRPYDDELRRCQRYWRPWGRAALGIWPAINSPSCRLTGPLGTEMRAPPTIALTTTAPIVERWNVSAYTGSGSTITTSSTYPRSVDVTINGFITTTNYSDAAFMSADYLTLNARL